MSILYQVVRRISQGTFRSLRHLQKKNIPEKFRFIVTNNRIVSAVQQSVNYFFALNSPILPKRSAEEKETLATPKPFIL